MSDNGKKKLNIRCAHSLQMYGFTLLMKNDVHMKTFFGEKYKNQGKLNQSGTPG